MDRAVSAALKKDGNKQNKLIKIWGSTLYHRDDLPYADDLSDLPDGFTPFRNKVESRASVRKPIPPPSRGALPLPRGVDFGGDITVDDLPFANDAEREAARRPTHPQSVLPFEGGESAALARVRYYVWESERIATYFETRNGMLGGDYSSKLAPWLAHGCVSPRHIEAEVRKFEHQRVENKSTYWLIFELIWRDFFKFFAAKHGDYIFFPDGTAGRGNSWKGGAGQWRDDPAALAAWKAGKTGFPLVDANMRELAATGFMSNRGRQNVASWLALDAGVDWRLGAGYFENTLLDYDCSANWGNWVAAAGMTGGRVNRFNIAKQTKDYDPKGEYIKAWIPELEKVPAQYIADPRQMPKDVAEASGCVVGVDYPPLSSSLLAPSTEVAEDAAEDAAAVAAAVAAGAAGKITAGTSSAEQPPWTCTGEAYTGETCTGIERTLAEPLFERTLAEPLFHRTSVRGATRARVAVCPARKRRRTSRKRRQKRGARYR